MNLLVHEAEHELFAHGGHLHPDIKLLVPLRRVRLVHDLGLELLAGEAHYHVGIHQVVVAVLHPQHALHPLEIVRVHWGGREGLVR